MTVTNPPYSILKSPLEEMVAKDEGFRSNIYRCSKGKLTIGYGTNLDAGLAEDEALVLMRYKLTKLDAELHRRYPWYGQLNQTRTMALLSMAYQLGIEGLSGFKKMLVACAQGDWQATHDEALDSKWAKSDTPERARRVAAMFLENETDED